MTTLLGDSLIGIYLHGSLAMGAFHPAHSDLDLLVVSADELTSETQRRLAEAMLERSGSPYPIEMSIVSRAALAPPLRFPLMYEFHYSEDWRGRFADDLADGRWRQWNEAQRVDPDLAAHLAVIQQRGICLVGRPIAAVIPAIPPDIIAAAIIEDVTTFAYPRRCKNPVYFVLNACRALAYLRTGTLLSKDEGGDWALTNLPTEHRPLIRQALAGYRGVPPTPFDDVRLDAFQRCAQSVALHLICLPRQ